MLLQTSTPPTTTVQQCRVRSEFLVPKQTEEENQSRTQTLDSDLSSGGLDEAELSIQGKGEK